jgi:predicted O-methyltransferase YrrM
VIKKILSEKMLVPQTASKPSFSLNFESLNNLLIHAKPLGHNEDFASLNLGFGFLYYGLARTLRPQHIVVIGSGFGYSVACFALGLEDNGGGQLTFIDPSFSVLANGPFKTIGGRNQWKNPQKVRAHFSKFGVEDRVTHYKMTSEAFFESYKQRDLPKIDLAFIDGNHAFKHVRHDFQSVVRYSRKDAYVLLHDTNIFVREFLRHSGVKRWLNSLRGEREAFECLEFPFSSGLAIVRVMEPEVCQQLV